MISPEELQNIRNRRVQYAADCLALGDFHGVRDAAADIEKMDAMLSIIRMVQAVKNEPDA